MFKIEFNRQEFATDTDISSGVQRGERELKPWVPDQDTPISSNLSLEYDLFCLQNC
jgi:hypothetical protein